MIANELQPRNLSERRAICMTWKVLWRVPLTSLLCVVIRVWTLGLADSSVTLSRRRCHWYHSTPSLRLQGTGQTVCPSSPNLWRRSERKCPRDMDSDASHWDRRWELRNALESKTPVCLRFCAQTSHDWHAAFPIHLSRFATTLEDLLNFLKSRSNRCYCGFSKRKKTCSK